MNLKKLLLNPSKTEFLLIGTKQQPRLKFSDLTNLSLGNDIISISSFARNLGFIFDSDMGIAEQINYVSKSCHFHIRDIHRIRHLLLLSAATALANSLVSSKLDYCNSLYSGISQANLNKLQRIQDSLAHVITNTSKYQHITPRLKKLHWLPIKRRNWLQTLFSHIQNTYKSKTYSFFPLHMSDHHLEKGLSPSSVHDSGIHYRLIPETRLLYQYPFQAQNTPPQNCVPSLGSFPSPLTVYPDFDSCYPHFMPYRMTHTQGYRSSLLLLCCIHLH